MALRTIPWRPWLGVLALVACASGPRRPERPPISDGAALVEAERLYRAGDPGFEEVRARLARDPAQSYWLTCLFLNDLVYAMDHQQATDETFLGAVVGQRSPAVERAVRALQAMGAAAVPAVTQELLRNGFSDRRELGADVLAEIGEPAVPAMMALLADGDARVRKAVVRALGAIEPSPAVGAALEVAARDADWAVRAASLAGLARQGPGQAERLRGALHDPDPYVRRTAAAELGRFEDRATAAALVDYLARALSDDDRRGAMAADKSLRRISGRARPGGLDFWRAWLASYDGNEGASREGR